MGTGSTGFPFFIGVDGIVFDEHEENLYATNFEVGEIIRFPVMEDGSAGTGEVFADGPMVQGVDGITIDDDGNLYAAANTRNAIIMVSEDGEVTTVAEGSPPFQNPSDVRFGKGDDEDTLYITNFAIFAGADAIPALLKMSVGDDDEDEEEGDDD